MILPSATRTMYIQKKTRDYIGMHHMLQNMSKTLEVAPTDSRVPSSKWSA